jgi:hypothetical protein
LVSTDPVHIPIEDYIRDYVTVMFPEARQHIKEIAKEVVKMLGGLHGVEKRSNNNDIRKRRADKYQWNISPLQTLLTSKILRVN